MAVYIFELHRWVDREGDGMGRYEWVKHLPGREFPTALHARAWYNDTFPRMPCIRENDVYNMCSQVHENGIRWCILRIR